MKKRTWIIGMTLLGLSAFNALSEPRQFAKTDPPPYVDNTYTGEFMQFGITNTYGEIMPFQCPIGVEHLMNGSYYCGYTLSYLDGPSEYLAYSVYYSRSNVHTGTYEEQIALPEIYVRTINQTANGALELQQNFTFRTDHKFILLESLITNRGDIRVDSLIYKITADWDVDGDWNDDDWDYDAVNHLPYAYESHYCTLYPVFPAPNIIDYDGFDDYDRRYTDLNTPPQFYSSFDGCELLHYNLGNLEPGQTSSFAVIFATDDSLGGLGQQIYHASQYLEPPGAIQGHVYDEQNLIALENTVVSNQFYGISDTTDANGFYRLDHVPVGNLLITAAHESYYYGNQLIRVISGDTTSYDFLLEQVMQTLLDVQLTPIGEPIVIPPAGGWFRYALDIENTYPTPQVVDFWSYILLPGSGMIPILTANNYNFPANSSRTKEFIQTIPTMAPSGIYSYFACLGEYPWMVLDSDSFSFEKSAGFMSNRDWSLEDWPCYEASGSNEPLQTASPSLSNPKRLNATPNPFNPLTTISFNLPQAGQVKLTVFDVMGREVAQLVNGMREAGAHNVTFDGSGLASGIYLYKLEAGDFSAINKMVLLK